MLVYFFKDIFFSSNMSGISYLHLPSAPFSQPVAIRIVLVSLPSLSISLAVKLLAIIFSASSILEAPISPTICKYIFSLLENLPVFSIDFICPGCVLTITCLPVTLSTPLYPSFVADGSCLISLTISKVLISLLSFGSLMFKNTPITTGVPRVFL